MRFPIRTTEQEREWEKRHILSLKERYLATDVLDKISKDSGYRFKVEEIEKHISGESGWVLDIGSNTAGECEYLVNIGYNIIATDINEAALSISKERCRKFGRKAPAYVACDGQRLPFRDNSVPCVMFNESLHHLPDPALAIREVGRVLSPGGKVFLWEPYAYDPWRRISEVRDYFRGTIETSFSVRQIKRFMAGAGLTTSRIDRIVPPPSRWKLDLLPIHRRFLRQSYYALRNVAPGIFGMVLCEAHKPGERAPTVALPLLHSLFACPETGAKLKKTLQGYVAVDPETRFIYPVWEDIPILITQEAKKLGVDAWQKTVG